MKFHRSLTTLIAAVGILPLFTGCDLSADFWHEETYTVDVAVDGEKSVDGTEELVDLSTKKEISDSLKKLKDFDIAEIWLEIPSVHEENKAALASGSLKMKGPGEGDQWIEVGKYKDFKIQKDGKIEVIPDAAMVDQVKSWAMNAPYKFFVTYSGEMDQLPAKFEVKARVHLVATVGM